MLDRAHYASLDLADLHDKVLAGKRLTLEDGERLFACPDPHALGSLAHHVRTRLHGDRAFYVCNRQVNYTNVCVNGCLFCAFHRQEGEDGAYLMDAQDVVARLRDTDLPVSEVHIVGGCHPSLGLEFYAGMVAAVKRAFPAITVKAFTAVEIAHFAALENTSTRAVLARLQSAGLDMLPGGGAEIFAEHVREKICPDKLGSADWLRVAEEAHTLGIRTNCTMLYGHLESLADRLDHLDRLRRLQDRTGGFVCFIPLPFLTSNSRLKLPPERVGPHTGLDDLKTMAVARLMLDNIPHLKAYWVMLGVKAAQAALHFGADDFDGTVLEERIGHSAGAESEQGLTRAQLEAMLRHSGFVPVLRDSLFNPLETAA